MKCRECKLAYGSKYCNYDDCEVHCLVTGNYVDIDEGSCTRTCKWISHQDVNRWKTIATTRTAKAVQEFLDFMDSFCP